MRENLKTQKVELHPHFLTFNSVISCVLSGEFLLG